MSERTDNPTLGDGDESELDITKEPVMEEEITVTSDEEDEPELKVRDNHLLFSSEIVKTKEEFLSVEKSLEAFLPEKMNEGKIRRIRLNIVPLSDYPSTSCESFQSTFKDPLDIHKDLARNLSSKTLFMFRGCLCDQSDVILLFYHHRRMKYDVGFANYDFGINYGTGEFDFYSVIHKGEVFSFVCDDSGSGFKCDTTKILVAGSRPSIQIDSLYNSTSFFYICDGKDYKCNNDEDRELFFERNPRLGWMKKRMNEKQNICVKEMEVFSVF